MERTKGIPASQLSMNWIEFWDSGLSAEETNDAHYDLPYWPVIVLLVNFVLITFLGP